MKVQWKKLGCIYPASNIHPKLCSHAANPLAIRLNGNCYRVFFSGRDSENRSSVGFFDLEITSGKVLYVHPEPVFLHGTPDTFFSHGVSVGTCYEASGNHYILFMGWHVSPGEHWRGEIGRLRVEGNAKLVLEPEMPLMPRDASDPTSLSYPWVWREPDGTYEMWYGSTIDWDAGNGEMSHVLKHAYSKDGNNWVRTGRTIPWKLGVAQAFSRPCVMGNRNCGYEMWFSYRTGTGKSYRIGYATSTDGIQWSLKLDEVGIDVSESGWDANMIEYPFVIDHDGDRYMLYNGNDFGKTGIGLAKMDIFQ